MNEVHHVRSPAVSRADAGRLTSNGVQGYNESFVLRNYDLYIYYHQFNLAAHFTLLRGRRLSIRSTMLFWHFAEVKLKL